MWGLPGPGIEPESPALTGRFLSTEQRSSSPGYLNYEHLSLLSGCPKAGDGSDLGRSRCPNRRRRWHPTPVLLPGKSRGQRSLVDCSPWGREESDTNERLHFHFSLSLKKMNFFNWKKKMAEEKEMATHSSVLAWRIPGTAEPGGLPSMGSHRVGHD